MTHWRLAGLQQAVRAGRVPPFDELCSSSDVARATAQCTGSFDAIVFDGEPEVSVVQEELCKGCGTCVAACPSGEAAERGFQDVQIFAEIEGVLV